MEYKNSIAIIRTKKGNTVGCHTVVTHNYITLEPCKHVGSGYFGDSFEMAESLVSGTVIFTIKDVLKYAEIGITNTVRFDNVTDIEITSIHEH